jgi:hypothetical protein
VQIRRFDLIAGLVLLGLAGATAAIATLGRTQPLTVAAIEPADGSREVSVRTQLRVTFTRPLDEVSTRTAVTLSPSTAGSVSVSGRRLALTPRHGLRAGTEYTLTLLPSLRDQTGRALAGPVVMRFRTRPLGLVARTADGTLVEVGLDDSQTARGETPQARTAHPAGPGVAAFAVGSAGTIASVVPGPGSGPGQLVLSNLAGERRIGLPSGVQVRDLEWAPGERALLFLAADAGSADVESVPYLVRPEDGTVTPFGSRPGPIDPGSALVVERLKKSLVEVVYRRESFALTPDGRAAIVRDQNWDFAVVAFDGTRMSTLGPVLAVGDVVSRGDALTVVDVDPSDGALRRQVLVYWTGGKRVAISAADHDSHSPRFAHAGDRVVFVTGRPEGLPARRRFALEVVDVATGRRRQLTFPPADMTDGAPRWAPDDSWISFVRSPLGADGVGAELEKGRVWLVPAEGGDARSLPIAATDARWLP